MWTLGCSPPVEWLDFRGELRDQLEGLLVQQQGLLVDLGLHRYVLCSQEPRGVRQRLLRRLSLPALALLRVSPAVVLGWF